MSKIIVTHPTYRNFPLNAVGVGKIFIDDKGEFETDNEEGVEELIANFPEYQIKGEGPQGSPNGLEDEPDVTIPPVDEDDETDLLQKTETNDFETNEDDNSDLMTPEEKQEFLDSLINMTKSELTELAVKFEFPGGSWRSLAKDALLEYLQTNIPAKLK